MSHLPALQPLLWHLTLTEWSSTSVYPCKGIILFQDSCLLIAVSLAYLERNDKCYKQKINCGSSGLMYPFQPTQSSSQATCWLSPHPLTFRILQDSCSKTLLGRWKWTEVTCISSQRKCLRAVFTCSLPLLQSTLDIMSCDGGIVRLWSLPSV